MQFRSIFIGVVLGLGVIASDAFAYTINDNFIGGTPTNAAYNGVDVIGAADKFGIDRMEVNISGGTLTVDIFSTYFDNVGELNTQLGDLFISTNGWHPFGTAPYTQDTATNGESWEFAVTMNNHLGTLGQSGSAGIYNVSNGAIVLSDALNNPNAVIFRGNQEVQFNPGQAAAVGSGTWTLTDLAGGTDKLTFSLALSSLGNISPEGLGFHWAISCGNDVIEGGMPTSVPEPTTALLLFSGAVGVLSRRKKTA